MLKEKMLYVFMCSVRSSRYLKPLFVQHALVYKWDVYTPEHREEVL
jgi:hypothetical protein